MGDSIRHSHTASTEAASKLVMVPAARRALHGRFPSSFGRRVKGAMVSDRALREWLYRLCAARSRALSTRTQWSTGGRLRCSISTWASAQMLCATSATARITPPSSVSFAAAEMLLLARAGRSALDQRFVFSARSYRLATHLVRTPLTPHCTCRSLMTQVGTELLGELVILSQTRKAA